MNNGKLIIINGTTSAGKTSIVRALQVRLAEPCLDFGLDKTLSMLPSHYFNQPIWNRLITEDWGKNLMSSMHHSMLNMMKLGNFIAADHILAEPTWVQECARLFHDQPAYLIGVHCPIEILEQRERDRKNRTIGTSRQQFGVVHKWTKYDLELDSSKISPEESADQIIDLIHRHQPKAFKNLLS